MSSKDQKPPKKSRASDAEDKSDKPHRPSKLKDASDQDEKHQKKKSHKDTSDKDDRSQSRKKQSKKHDDECSKSRDNSAEERPKKKSTKKKPSTHSNQSDLDNSVVSESRRKTQDNHQQGMNYNIMNQQQYQQQQMSPQNFLQDDLQLLQQNMEKKCVHHDLVYQFFCESCEEPICRQCTIMGPHNNQLHRINRLEEAFRSRVIRLNESIRQNLIPKRDQLLAQIHRLEYRIEEIRYVKTIIERDARAEYGGVIERLKSAEGIKVAVLQHEMSELQKDLDRINDIGHSFNQFSQDQGQPIPFLLRARNLYENIEFQVAKPYKQTIDVYPYDLPRELTEMRLQLQKVHAQKALVDFKNEVIWRLIEEKKETEDKVKQQMEEAAFQELQEWARLTEKYSNELKKFYLVCFYCNTTMDEVSVNKKCTQNTQALDPDFKGYADKVPDSKFHGNHRHFFARPVQDYVEYLHDNRTKERVLATGDNKMKIFIEVQLSKIKKLCEENDLDLQDIFEKHDKNKNRTVNSIQFTYIMTDMIGISEQESARLNKFFDPSGQGFFEYEKFLDLMDDPKQIDQFPVKE